MHTLNQCHTRTVRICCCKSTSLRGYQPLTSTIACLHITNSRHQTLASLIGRSLHIVHVTTGVDCLNLPWLVHILHLSSVWTVCIIVWLKTLVSRHRVLRAPVAFGLHIGKSSSSHTFLHILWPTQNRKATSDMAHLHLLWPTNNGKTTSNIACPHRFLHAHIS